ncbi:MAG TPA: amylo-alpha-1,6-glucosidase [Stellaceae bacterium]|nr:amylo-alpha-1,6-glucosidase [Stellaceae bacterium]
MKNEVVRVVCDENPKSEAQHEWLVTNGLGGFASATVSGEIARRYHGFLIAALPAPLGRVVLLNDLDGEIERADGSTASIRDAGSFAGFSLSMGLPSWRWEMDGLTLERSVLMPARHNTVHITFRLIGAATGVRLRLRPFISFRQLEAAVDNPLADRYRLIVQGQRYEVYQGPDLPTLRMIMAGCDGSTFTADGGMWNERLYRTEAERGYEARGWVWSPGYFTAELRPDCAVTLIAGTEDWHTMASLTPDQARRFEIERRRRLVAMAEPELHSGLGGELVLAADSFIITPVGRVADIARAHAEGNEVRTIIAGYHWFTDWGRDTMISLEGLTLATGRVDEAKWILRTFADYVQDGLIPNMFPEGDTEGLYHTADATLWFFHAVARYLARCPDEATLEMLLPIMHEIVRRHIEGCKFGIGVDPQDGLLAQGAEGYQLTWMDAKVGDWIVTPRRGKAVEINALWYNALRLLADWLRAAGNAEADDIAARAEQARRSFNRRFWYDRGGYLYDVIDSESGDDPAFRPNQILAISLDHPVLDRERWRPVVDSVREKLVTPVGLRSLAPDDPAYKPRYFGDLRARDAAYHQGTVWGWLIGPFIDAWLKTYPDQRKAAHGFLSGFEAHLGEAAIGSISEIFDADPPFTPRGCVAQAWSVAEVLRVLVKTAR